MKTIHQSYEVNATPEEVFNALVTPEIIEQWSGAPARMDDQPGTRFELWGGDIYGTNLEVVSGSRLVQEWYGGDWKEPSKATFNIKPNGRGSIVELIHENVPEEEYDNINEGWNKYYLGPLREIFT